MNYDCSPFSFKVHFINTKEKFTRCKSDPSGIRNNISVPVTGNEKDNGRSYADAAGEYADQGQEPLGLQSGGVTDGSSVVHAHAGPHQSQSGLSCVS